MGMFNIILLQDKHKFIAYRFITLESLPHKKGNNRQVIRCCMRRIERCSQLHADGSKKVLSVAMVLMQGSSVFLHWAIEHKLALYMQLLIANDN